MNMCSSSASDRLVEEELAMEVGAWDSYETG